MGYPPGWIVEDEEIVGAGAAEDTQLPTAEDRTGKLQLLCILRPGCVRIFLGPMLEWAREVH